MGYLEGYMLPSNIEGCIKGKKRCKFLKEGDAISVKGKKFWVYVCSCEEEMCAGCIPTFEDEENMDKPSWLNELGNKIYMMFVGILFTICFIGSFKLLISSYDYVADGYWFGVGITLMIGLACVLISSILMASWILAVLKHHKK